MAGQIAIIGFGEAGQAFALDAARPIRAYDRKTYVGPTRRAKLADYARLNVEGALTNQVAVAEAELILSVVTADKALAAARETARGIGRDAVYCDMNSVAPETKRMAAEAIERVGARYVDVAIMAPVDPKGRDVPLLVSGPAAAQTRTALRAFGFSQVTAMDGEVGAAAAVKMIRSVMVKGIEALTAECFLAAEAAGVREAVLASLDASWPEAGWSSRADYNLDRMMTHGARRAAEMEEAARTLAALGIQPAMTDGTVKVQRAIGNAAIVPPDGLARKLAVLARASAHAGKQAA